MGSDQKRDAGRDWHITVSRKIKNQFFVWYAKQFPNCATFKILDFGCGHGHAVELMRQEGMQCYGVDVFYEGDSYESLISSDVFRERIIRRISDDARIPFGDGFFDLIFSNQVMEHVEHKDFALKELSRVLKSDGVILLKFPTREAIFEGHINMPFVHWFPKGHLRRSYVVLLRRLGFGSRWLPSSAIDFARVGLDWIDRFCFYDCYAQFHQRASRCHSVRHREIDFCRFRAKDMPLLDSLLRLPWPQSLCVPLLRLLGLNVLELRKEPSRSTHTEG